METNVLFLEQIVPPSTSQTRARTREFVRLSCGISGGGRSFSTLFDCSLNFQSASYLDRQCMHCRRMNQYNVRGSQWG